MTAARAGTAKPQAPQTQGPAISLRGVTKTFALEDPHGSADTFKRWLTDVVRGRRHAPRLHPALHPLDLDIELGETLGLIGRNGSGKSTLLRLIAGIYHPDAGTIRTQGRLAPLLSLGGGFHPDFTGRDNILIEAMLLGLSRRDVRQRLEAIVAFAELGGYIDQPLRTYSTGMYMRLAFAVAVQVEPDILLLDETLAVGDEAFNAKCIQKIHELKTRSLTIVLATHDLAAARTLSDRVLWLDAGRVRAYGPPEEVVDAYHEYVANLAAAAGGATAAVAAPA